MLAEIDTAVTLKETVGLILLGLTLIFSLCLIFGFLVMWVIEKLRGK